MTGRADGGDRLVTGRPVIRDVAPVPLDLRLLELSRD